MLKKINPQWVFLIILALWVPALCVADDITIEEARQKAEHVQRMTELKEATTETAVTRSQLADEPSLMIKVYGYGLMVAAGIGAISILGIWFVTLRNSIKFNYNHYIANGMTTYTSTDDYDEKELRIKTAKAVGLKGNSIGEYPWFNAVGLCLFVALIIVLFVLLWPLALIFLGPNELIEMVGKRVRKKKVFVDKLKDNETNGIV